jgi:hypothetical protein
VNKAQEVCVEEMHRGGRALQTCEAKNGHGCYTHAAQWS